MISDDSIYSEEDLKALEKLRMEFEKRVPVQLRSLYHYSIVRQTPRGIRRYFPLEAKSKDDLNYLKEAFYIFYGREPKDNVEFDMVLKNKSLDYYIEEFAGRLWVRTTID